MPNSEVGGAANERGSMHRSGAAALLAVHGMLGKAIDERPGAVPTRIHLEASEDVDDIVVTMTDGAKWYLQCKRSAGVDAPLRATIAQWLRQSYTAGDRLGLVAREFRGELRRIQDVIDQLNDGQGPPLSTRQAKCLTTVTGELENAGCSDPDSMTRDLLFLQFATEFTSDAQRQVACALLRSVAPPDQAESAFNALRGLMQASAANRRWTEMADWLTAIEAAGIEVNADITGVPAAAATAKRQAIRAHRDIVSRPRDQLSLTALSPRLRDVHVDNLLKDWNVRWDAGQASESLLRVARRNTRFVLTGLPGIGKSEAMRQLAAHLASDADAPVPIRLDLKESLPTIHAGGSITLDGLLRQVSEHVVGIDPAVTTAALRDALLSGNAIVIVDGLDEARSRRGTVAADLASILEDLPPATGFILSTRPSAVDAALQLGLPSVELESPKSLDRSLPAITRALAPAGVAGREAWVEERVARLRLASQRAHDIWKVPLLATLATLRIANNGRESTNPVELLSNVIDDSVTAWEQLKANHADGLDPDMRPSMLSAGFETIGCLINTTAATVDAAEAAVEKQLEPWNLPTPLRGELARQVVHFWDERVGVFVKTGDTLAARSRQFAELADARRAGRLPDPEKKSWIATSLEDADLRPTVQLAVQSDDGLRQHLLDLAERGAPESIRGRAVSWAGIFAVNWSGMPVKTEKQVIDLLANAAEDHLSPPAPGTSLIERITSSGRDDGGWHFAVQLTRLPRSDTLREHHRARIRGLALSPQQRDLLELHIALKEAKEQQRSLSRDEIALVSSLLDAARPAEPKTTYRKGAMVIDAGERYMEGTSDVVALAVEHVEQLPPGSSDKFVAMAKRLSHGTFEKVTIALSKRGYKVDLSHLTSAFESFRSATEFLADNHGLGWLLRILADLPVNDSPGVAPEPWRWGEISELVSAISWGKSPVRDTQQLLDTSLELQSIWINAVVNAYGLDRGRLKSEAQAILLADNDENAEALTQICTQGLTERHTVRALNCDEAALLARCFASGSEEIVTQAADLTINTGCAGVSSVIEALDVRMTWQGRFLSTAVSIATAAERPGLIELYRRSGSSQRAAVALIAASLPDKYPDVLAELREDRDAAVRFRCDGDVRLAEIWTCRHCRTENPVTQDSCEQCHITSECFG